MQLNVVYNGTRYVSVSPEHLIKKGVPTSVIDTAVAEQRWSEIRTQRDALLRASDYAVMPDYPLADDELAAVKQYRQALRDIPETADDPDAIEWPEKPEVLA